MQDNWENKYKSLFCQYKKDIIFWNERERRNQETRFEMLQEIDRANARFDKLNEDFQGLLQSVDKGKEYSYTQPTPELVS